MKNYAVALFFCYVLAPGAGAQLPQYHAQVFGAEQGIGGGGIMDVFKDPELFLWVQTATTLQRFDGRNLRQYAFPNTLTHTAIDDDGRIWALAGQSVYRMSADRKGFETVPFDTSGRVRLRGIFKIANYPVQAIATNGLHAWNPASGKFERIAAEMPPPGGRHFVSRLDTCGTTLFYPGKGRICSYNLATGEARSLPFKAEFAHLLAVTADLAVVTGYLNASFWLDFKNGKVQPIDAVQYGLSKSEHRINLIGLVAMGDGQFLVSTQFGLHLYDLKADQFSPKRIFAGGIPIENENTLQRIFQDKDGAFWGHMNIKVVAFYPTQNALGLLRNYHFEPPHQWDDRVYGLTEDNLGNIWFGGAGGFKKLHLNSGKITAFLPKEDATDRLAHASVRGLVFDGQNLVLGPTNFGVWLFNPVTERYRRPSYASDSVRIALESDFIDYIGILRNGDMIVCGRHHPYCIKPVSYRVDFLPFPGDNSNLNVVFQDLEKRIWFGSENGLFCLTEDYRFLFEVPVMPTESVHCLFQIRQNEFLVGMAKGLRRMSLQSNGWRIEPMPTPAEGFAVTNIFQDSLKRYWISTHDGLYVSEPPLTLFSKLDFSDNIQSNIFNAGTFLRAGNGMVFLGGQDGINYFFPEKIILGDRPLQVSIQSVSINDGDRVLHHAVEPLALEYGQNTLAIEVVAPFFNNATKVQYRYRLRGLSDTWVLIGSNNTVRLPNLPPGKYRLEVSASITGNVWYDAPNPFLFNIQPPFWQRWPFRLAILAAFGACIWGYIRYRENMVRKRQQEQLELEKLKNTNLLYQLETEQVVNYFSRSISSKNTVDEVLWDVAQQCISRLGWEDCVIYLLEADRGVLIQKAAWGLKSSADYTIICPMEIAVGEGIVGSVAQSGKAEMVADTGNDARYIKDDAMRLSELAVPMLSEGKVIGVIDSEHSQKHFYTPWHLHILTAIAALCSHKIALAQSEEARQHALLEAIDNQRKAAESKLQSLRLQMNPHFLFNALNSIQQMTMSGNGDGAALYLSKFSKLLRMVLTHSDHDRISLREELDMLQLYLELESLRFDDTFSYTIACENGLDKEEYKIPTLLIQPFVENAIWHGLLHKEGKRHLKVRFETSPDEDLVCIIEDNGIGREAARAYTHKSQRTGKGVSISADRLQTLNYQQNQNNTLEIKDLHDRNGTPTGTQVTITLG